MCAGRRKCGNILLTHRSTALVKGGIPYLYRVQRGYRKGDIIGASVSHSQMNLTMVLVLDGGQIRPRLNGGFNVILVVMDSGQLEIGDVEPF